MKTIIQFIHSILAYPAILISTILASLAAAFFGFFNPHSNLTTSAIRLWGRSLLWLSGSKLIIEGLENIEPDKAYVFAANHLGALDIPGVIFAIPQTARFIAKKELFRIPLFSMGMRNSGMLKIDRGNSEEARKTLDEAIGTIKNGCSVVIFPEGTRSKSGQIQNFKKGAFILALNGRIPIIPTVIMGTQHSVSKNNLIKSGSIKIKFLPAIDTTNADYEQRNKLVQIVKENIVSEFEPDFNKGEI
ncbi:MAG: 1-acyl-sn-glycerol-3-phosphate acyltransferase [Calditrichaeota bacterium]|nr:MAG: 1-acyl-sn-glycerol-3-phosphate acyltransferase [Calditrichota bacterium]MBL1204531.1 1-acyl-sn-glycerol-3-phosphate acyltransferase [Calditrichota bacterium]NOG44359.1 1-acyl-sn-glycerol-3-phosphate acyltransferase [Calditrichota bacterium]